MVVSSLVRRPEKRVRTNYELEHPCYRTTPKHNPNFSLSNFASDKNPHHEKPPWPFNCSRPLSGGVEKRRDALNRSMQQTGARCENLIERFPPLLPTPNHRP